MELWEYIPQSTSSQTSHLAGGVQLESTSLRESRGVAVTALDITYTMSLLAVGYEDGCVNILDMEVSVSYFWE